MFVKEIEMKAFIVYCHPSEDSFTCNNRDSWSYGFAYGEKTMKK